MNQRFVILTFTACTVMFAGIWAATAPPSPPVAAPVAGAPAMAGVVFADCDAVRAANAAPLRAGQPGYRAALDPNMNGIACETTGGTADPAPVAVASSDDAAPVESQPPPDLPPPPQIDLPPPDPRTTNFPPLQ